MADLTVGEQQRVEILKPLYRGVNVLLLDELTTVLTPRRPNVVYLLRTRPGL